ncbi:MAG: hypothetical protein KDD22_01285 [Bdellovibrionales bacterium]|nr:hypothetical protein [Bdellovibrionales bacterium]
MAKVLASLICLFIAPLAQAQEEYDPVQEMCFHTEENLQYCYENRLIDSLLVESYFSANSDWYCKKVNFIYWRRCSRKTGQCIPPDFDEEFQCERALP